MKAEFYSNLLIFIPAASKYPQSSVAAVLYIDSEEGKSGRPDVATRSGP